MTIGERCSEQVYDSIGFGHFYQCSKRGVITRDDKLYCKVHDPEYVAAKKKMRESKWEEEHQERMWDHKLLRLATAIFKDIDNLDSIEIGKYRVAPELYEALKNAVECIRMPHRYTADESRAILEAGQDALAKAEGK